MQSRFTKKAQEALDHAAETAAMLGHGYIGSEHLLIGLIQAEDSLASTVLLNNDVTAEKIINLVYQLIAPDNQVGVKEPVRLYAACTPAFWKIQQRRQHVFMRTVSERSIC